MKASIITVWIKAEKMNRFGQPWLGARDARSPMTWCKRPDSAATAGNFVNSPILSPLFLSMYSLTCKLLSETVLRGICKISQSFSKLSAHFFQSPPKNLKKKMSLKQDCSVVWKFGWVVWSPKTFFQCIDIVLLAAADIQKKLFHILNHFHQHRFNSLTVWHQTFRERGTFYKEEKGNIYFSTNQAFVENFCKN